MVGKLKRCLLLSATLSVSMLAAASGGAIQSTGLHREDVDVSRYPWSAIGKLYNETGSACSGVAIASDKILTAAHCLFNYRTRRYIPATALHFLLGYRAGQYTAHVRIARYEIGPGFDPLRYWMTFEADWAVLTVSESLPARIAPLRLSRNASPHGTKAMIAGYSQDRAHALTADRDCELREDFDDGRLFLHTCRGARGDSGAPILVSADGHELRVAGIQIASVRGDGTEKMVAVSAQTIGHQGLATTGEVAPGLDASEPKIDTPQDVADAFGWEAAARAERTSSEDEPADAFAESRARIAANETIASHAYLELIAAP
jgi:protease YdgD